MKSELSEYKHPQQKQVLIPPADLKLMDDLFGKPGYKLQHSMLLPQLIHLGCLAILDSRERASKESARLKQREAETLAYLDWQKKHPIQAFWREKVLRKKQEDK